MFFSMSWLGTRQDALHFCGGNDRQDSRKDQHEREEESEGAQEDAEVHHGGFVESPGRRQKILREADDDDDEALEPHADGYRDGH